MHPAIIQALGAEQTTDMRDQAERWRRARELRRERAPRRIARSSFTTRAKALAGSLQRAAADL